MLSLPISTHKSDISTAIKYQRLERKDKRYIPSKIVPHTRKTAAKLPKLTLVFDTEATITPQEDGSEIQTLKFGYALFRRYLPKGGAVESDYLRFDTAESFYAIIDRYSRQGTKLYCFAHNLGYDWSLIGINPVMLANGWSIDTLMDRKANTVVIYKRDKHTVVFIDTLNLFKAPLDRLAQDFGLKKGSVDFKTADLSSLEEYCKQDVHILDTIILEWRDFLVKHNYGAFKATIASQALEIFKQKYLDAPIYTDHGKAQKLLERNCYYGGRVECNIIGTVKDDLYHIDINGAYPSVMKNNKFPYKFCKEIKNPTIDDVEAIGNDQCCFAFVAIESDKAFYPKRDGDKLIFPVGQFKTWLAEPELRLAIRSGHIKHIYSLYLYLARPLFTHYIADIYRQRRGAHDFGNKSRELMFKLLGNALYGKFGEWRRQWRPVGVEHNFPEGEHYEADLRNRRLFKVVVIDGIRYKYLESSMPSHSFPLVAAFTTSYLRVKLLEAMELVGRDNWLYADTDSLVLTRQGFFKAKSIIHASTLGKWKLEAKGDEISIRGLKDYVFSGQEKIKGIPRKHVKVSDSRYDFAQFDSMHKTICNNTHGQVKVQTVSKELQRIYYKGQVDANGRVRPFHLKEFT